MEARSAWPRMRSLVAQPFADVGSPTPFGRLALVHVLMVSGDTLVAVALAGSLFFSISPEAARDRVALYLVLTMTPFAVIGPALGPLLDRGKGVRRAVVMASAGLRVPLFLLMAHDVHSLLFFPEAFLALVASKTYMVSKASLVPATIRAKDDLVKANSRLALLAGIAGLVAGVPAAGVLKLFGAAAVLWVAAAVMVVAAVAATKLPRAAIMPADPAAEQLRPGAPVEEKWAPVQWAPITLVAASAMAVLRGTVGFVTFQLAFELRREHAAAWWFGVIVVAAVVGSLLGALVAPRMRRAMREESILLTGLGLVSITGIGAALVGGRWAQAGLAMVVGLSASFGKLGFDALVQRDAPEPTYGRAFARFETRFQLAWVVGALIPVAVSLAPTDGDIVAAMVTAVAGLSYAGARRALGGHDTPRRGRARRHGDAGDEERFRR